MTRRGKAIGSISGKKSAKSLAVEALIGSADFPHEYDNPSYDPDYELAREADYSARGGNRVKIVIDNNIAIDALRACLISFRLVFAADFPPF